MNHVLRKGLNVNCTMYLDDILVFFRSPEEHEEHLKLVFQALKEHSLCVKRSKCEFGKSSIEYLGHVVSAEGVRPDPRKTEVVRSWPVPRSVKETQSFLGMTNYYSAFIPQYAQVAAPLTSLLRKGSEWSWGDA